MFVSRFAAAALAVASVGLFASPASAALTFYTDYASWSAAVSGAIVATTVADPAPAAVILHGAGDAGVTYDGIQYDQSEAFGGTDPRLFTVGVGASGRPAVVSSQATGGGTPNITMTLPAFTRAFAVNFGVYGDEGDGFDVAFDVFGDEAGSIVRTVFGQRYQASYFFGVISDDDITAVRASGGSDLALNVRDVQYVAVPEPATWALMLLGFGGAGAALRTRRRATA